MEALVHVFGQLIESVAYALGQFFGQAGIGKPRPPKRRARR